jgi:ubiquinone/menaquinone biosynthesis C-methylase UbiE
MLPRILEPEAMDTDLEARDYDAMDHSAVNRVFVAEFLAIWDGRDKGGATPPLLDVGTGTAQIPIELCRRHATVHVTAIDLAEFMLRVGADNVRRAGLGDRIRLERRDAKHLPYAAGSFGAVISNSIVHHIPVPAAVMAEMVRVVVPGGVLVVRDLLRPPDEATLKRLVELHTPGANAHQRQMFADSLHAALNLAEVRELVSDLGFDPVTVQQTTDRHWTWQAKRTTDEGRRMN